MRRTFPWYKIAINELSQSIQSTRDALDRSVGHHGPIGRTIFLVATLLERAGAHRLVAVCLIEDGRIRMAVGDGISTLDVGATRARRIEDQVGTLHLDRSAAPIYPGLGWIGAWRARIATKVRGITDVLAT
jgi:hypothetical protein